MRKAAYQPICQLNFIEWYEGLKAGGAWIKRYGASKIKVTSKHEWKR